MPENAWLFLLLALVAEVLGTISGFGSSILFVPIAAQFFDFKAVLAITAVFHVFSNLSKIYLFRQGIDRSIALKLGLPAVLFVVLGAWLSNRVPQKELEVAMNLLLLVLAAGLLLHSGRQLARTNTNLVLGGVSSGFLAGLVGTGGALRGLTLAAFNLEKGSFVATSALIDLGVDSSRAVVYWLNGYWQNAFWVYLPFLLGISLLGSYLGKRILEHISEQWFRYLVLGVIVVTALVGIFL